MDRHLSPTETARRFGVSIKALRLYEQRGLLAPARSGSAWRACGPDPIARQTPLTPELLAFMRDAVAHLPD